MAQAEKRRMGNPLELRAERVWVAAHDLGDPGDVDTPADLPERLRVP